MLFRSALGDTNVSCSASTASSYSAGKSACRKLKLLMFASPKASAILCRSTLENAINWLYNHDAKLIRPFKAELSALMYEHCFASQFNQTMLGELHLIRKTGNVAAHGSKVSQQGLVKLAGKAMLVH